MTQSMQRKEQFAAQGRQQRQPARWGVSFIAALAAGTGAASVMTVLFAIGAAIVGVVGTTPVDIAGPLVAVGSFAVVAAVTWRGIRTRWNRERLGRHREVGGGGAGHSERHEDPGRVFNAAVLAQRTNRNREAVSLPAGDITLIEPDDEPARPPREQRANVDRRTRSIEGQTAVVRGGTAGQLPRERGRKVGKIKEVRGNQPSTAFRDLPRKLSTRVYLSPGRREDIGDGRGECYLREPRPEVPGGCRYGRRGHG
jgi:membrane protein implicated in regulation of membrane protease activity